MTGSFPSAMRRTRLVLTIWTVLALLVAGAWLHSLYRYSGIGYANSALGRQVGVRVLAGSLEILWGNTAAYGSRGFSAHSLRWKDPGPGRSARPRTFGRFWWHTNSYPIGGGTTISRTNIEVPFWFLLLLLTLFAFLLHRFLSRRRSAHHAPPPPP